MTADDYEQTVEPLLAEELRQDRRLRLLLEIGPEFVGFTAGALWGKVETWRHSPTLLRRIDGYALVSDVRWIVRFLVSFPLRVDALGATADTWLATHDALPGVVLHAHTFPGWENIGSLLRHVRFVRDHHRRVRRVAVAVDGSATTSTAPSRGRQERPMSRLRRRPPPRLPFPAELDRLARTRPSRCSRIGGRRDIGR